VMPLPAALGRIEIPPTADRGRAGPGGGSQSAAATPWAAGPQGRARSSPLPPRPAATRLGQSRYLPAEPVDCWCSPANQPRPGLPGRPGGRCVESLVLQVGAIFTSIGVNRPATGAAVSTSRRS